MNKYYIEKNVEVSTGPKGQKGVQVAIDHAVAFGEKRIIEIMDGVYSATAFAAANTIFVETANGVIAVDCADGEHSCKAMIDAYYESTGSKKPIVGVIYTHWHYALGAMSYQPYMSEDCQIWADDKLIPNLQGNSVVLGESVSQRGSMHMGVLLPETGEDGILSCGIGSFFVAPGAEREVLNLIPPTHYVSDVAKFEIDGMKVELYNHPSDVTDNIIVHFPDLSLTHQNNLWPGIFNISTSRGDRYRDPLVLLSGLQRIIDLKPEVLSYTHGLTTYGAEENAEKAQIYKDSIEYIYNQAVRGINDGLDADEIVERFDIPASYLESSLTAELYGEYAYHLRGIYAGLVGFPTFDPSRFHKLPRKVEGEKMIFAFGGLRATVDMIKAAIEEEEYLWATQLANYVIAVNPDEQSYKNLKAEAMRALGQRASAATSRNQFITYALYLEGKVSIDLASLPFNIINFESMSQTPIEGTISLLKYRINGTEAFDTGMIVKFEIGAETSANFKIEHGVMTPVAEEANVVVKSTKEDYANYIARNISFCEYINLSEVSSHADQLKKIFI